MGSNPTNTTYGTVRKLRQSGQTQNLVIISVRLRSVLLELQRKIIYRQVMELADMRVSNTRAFGRMGSNPILATMTLRKGGKGKIQF